MMRPRGLARGGIAAAGLASLMALLLPTGAQAIEFDDDPNVNVSGVEDTRCTVGYAGPTAAWAECGGFAEEEDLAYQAETMCSVRFFPDHRIVGPAVQSGRSTVYCGSGRRAYDARYRWVW